MRRAAAPAWERHGLVILVPDLPSSGQETIGWRQIGWPPVDGLDRKVVPAATPSWQGPCGCPDDCPRDHQED